MKRSEINHIISKAKDFLTARQFELPEWALWSLDDWRAHRSEVDYITERMLGWDITDFGSGDYLRRGLFLFTLRNGKPGADRKPYAEKIMMVEEGQETPIVTFDMINAESAPGIAIGDGSSDVFGSADISYLGWTIK